MSPTTPDRRRKQGPAEVAAREALRREAESRVTRLMDRAARDAPLELQRLIHELGVHQVELEMQNEQLRQAQVALEHSQARYFDLYTEAPVGYCTLGPGGRIVDCNRRGADLLGLPQSALINRRLADFLLPEQIASYRQVHDRVVASGEAEVTEVRLRRGDGTLAWVELAMNLSRDERDELLLRVAITDTTERRRMLDDVARLAAIVTSSDQAILSQALDGTVTSWNAGAEHLLGYSEREMVGGYLRALFPPDRLAEENDNRFRALRGETLTLESVRVHKAGNSVPIVVTISPILDDAGRIVGVSHIARDISSQVETRRALAELLAGLKESEAALREADRRKDDFIATLAHELRNPLAPIRNAAAVLRFVPDLDPRVVWCRDVIDRQVGHMAALLEDLLDVSRLARDVVPLRHDRVELTSAIGYAVETTRPLFEAKGHRLELELPPTAVEVEGDLIRLSQVFANLLNNASKYTEPNGTITVTVEQLDAEVVVRVGDTGIGIEAGHLRSIFQLFSQVDGAMERAQGGLGIGLALVKGLVERHGGSISAHSEGLGRGSQFVVTLPLVTAAGASGPQQGTADPAAPGGLPPARRRILVVDDNPDEAESLALLLQLEGHQVRTAPDGEGAFKLARDWHPDVLLLDVGMPGLSGHEVGRRIRQESWGQAMVIVACTGWGQAEDRRLSREAGFDVHLVKPVNSAALHQVVAIRRGDAETRP